ncbi:MAG: M48 family metalloprotease [Bacteroidales bacterium]|nr:M48 family metalloprotease [Bacteroidales bacterium]
MKTSRIFIAFLVIVLCVGKLHAQQQQVFDGIKCSGTMPADLRKNMEQLYQEDKQRVRDYNNGKLTNRDKVLSSSYYISRLMASGRILYGDPVTQMLDRIVDTLLIDYPEIRKEIRVYSVKSSEVNAFATGQGMLFVNLGLVAQVEDEAQLAFVLSHEIIHYVRKHSLEKLTRKKTTMDTTAQEGLTNFLRYHSRSREMEREADSLGVEMFYARSPYDKRVADGFFDVLQYGYLPFDEVVFDTTMFNTPHFKFSNGTFVDKVAPISAREDYNDSLSTHPNILKRRTATVAQMASMNGGRHYVVTDKNSFEQLRDLARMECIRQDLIFAEYASAYYNCYVMLRQQPDNTFLQLAKAQAIYGASKFRSYTSARSMSDYRNKEGEIQQVYHMMRRAKPNELTMVAIRDIWAAHKRQLQEQRLTNMVQDLVGDLHNKHNFKTDAFSMTFDTASSVSNVDTTASSNSKYSNVKRRRRQQQSQEPYRYVFTDLIQNDSEFATLFNNAMVAQVDNTKTITSKGSFLFSPTYMVVNDMTGELKIEELMSKESTLANDIVDVCEKVGFKTVDFSDEAMRQHDDAGFYNDFMTLNEWANEFWQTRGNVRMSYLTQPGMDDLMQRYGADKLSLGFVGKVENIDVSFRDFFRHVSFSVGVALPEAVYALLSSHHSTLVRNMIVDTRDGSLISRDVNIINQNDSRALVKSQLYASTLKGVDSHKTPGYLGRRFIIEGTGGLSFTALNKLFRDNPEHIDNVAWRYGGGAEFVVGTHSSIALTADIGKTRFDISYEPVTEAKITTLALAFRHYFGSNIAPLGPYGGFGLSLSQLNLRSLNAGQPLMYLDEMYRRPAIHLEFGHNSILADRLVVNICVRHNLTIANPVEAFFEDDPYWYGSSSDLKNPVRNLNANLWMYNLVSLHLSIGFLPF